MNHRETRAKMNALGAANQPFVFLLDFELRKCLVFHEEEVPQTLLYSTPTGGNVSLKDISLASENPLLEIEAVPLQVYETAFSMVQKELHHGNTFLLNLTFPSKISLSCDLEYIFAKSRAPYKVFLKDQFVVFSPESFVHIQDGWIRTCPMKGTIRADIPDAEKLLLSSAKETAEHDTTIDLLRNDLSVFASEVHVSRYRYIESIEGNRGTLLQMSSEIMGKLTDGYASRLGDFIVGMLPAGSISGAPKRQTLDIIRSAEASPRGYYTGVFGHYRDGTLDSAVLIRFVEKRGEGEYYFRSGCGITAMSQMKEEYQELKDKIYLPF